MLKTMSRYESPNATSLIRRFVFVALAAAAALAVAASAEDGGGVEARVARGKVSFRIYCQNCHGKEADGTGPIAELLTVKPADLTTIARRNEGTFPAERIYAVVDGREEVRGHGSREMPIWGLTFQDPTRSEDQEDEVRARILDLVAFLESIQR